MKPSNLLLDENWKVKVADFGLSCILFNSFVQDKTVAIGSARWMAPEVLMGRKLNDKLDVYRFTDIILKLTLKLCADTMGNFYEICTVFRL